MSNWHRLSLVELRDALASKRVGAVDVTKHFLARIDRLNPTLNAFREVFHERAVQQAEGVDEGRRSGPLAGVPIAVKDNLCTEYGATTCSSKMLANFRSPYTATVVKRLEDAGAVIVGKTNLDEFAMGSSSENCASGLVRNPWDHQRVPGGSSGGSAAAVAAGLCAAALGSDTGGSIRQPAAYCGIVGLKPTYGRVSRYGLVAYASSLDQVGPMTHTVADAALLLGVIAGHDPLDSTCANTAAEDYAANVAQPLPELRVGLAKQYLSNANDPAVREMVQRAVGLLASCGASMVEVDLPHTEYGIPTYYIVATAEASSNLARYDGVRYGHRSAEAVDLIDLYARSRSEGFGQEVKRRIMLGTYVLSSGYYDAYYLRAMKVRRLIQRDFIEAFQRCDVLLGPTTTGPAFKIGQKIDDPLAMYLEDLYTVNCNLAGIPGLSLPGGVTQRDGQSLPLGLQLFAAPDGESTLLRAARMLERAVGFESLRTTN